MYVNRKLHTLNENFVPRELIKFFDMTAIRSLFNIQLASYIFQHLLDS